MKRKRRKKFREAVVLLYCFESLPNVLGDENIFKIFWTYDQNLLYFITSQELTFDKDLIGLEGNEPKKNNYLMGEILLCWWIFVFLF